MVKSPRRSPEGERPTHYRVKLAKPFPVPERTHVIPAGVSIVAAAIKDMIPTEIMLAAAVAAKV